MELDILRKNENKLAAWLRNSLELGESNRLLFGVVFVYFLGE